MFVRFHFSHPAADKSCIVTSDLSHSPVYDRIYSRAICGKEMPKSVSFPTDPAFIVLGAGRLALGWDADRDEGERIEIGGKADERADRILFRIVHPAPGGAEPEVGHRQEEVLRRCGHVLVEPLIPLLPPERDHDRTGVNPEVCVRVRKTELFDLLLLGDHDELPRLGVVRRRGGHRRLQRRDERLPRDRVSGELADRPALGDELQNVGLHI